jgi:hypothetical protein
MEPIAAYDPRVVRHVDRIAHRRRPAPRRGPLGGSPEHSSTGTGELSLAADLEDVERTIVMGSRCNGLATTT